MKQLSIPITSQTDLVNESLTTTSLIIAKKFKKQHKDVLRAIENLEVPTDFRERNFALTSYLVAQPKGGTRKETYYTIIRDGFVNRPAAVNQPCKHICCHCPHKLPRRLAHG